MNRSSVSIKDIARRAGVSHSTVSRALRGSDRISEETRARIQRLAIEMGYIPNAIAQSLQTRRTRTIGLVVTSIADPFFTDVVAGVEMIAQPAGFSLLLSTSHNDPDQEIQVIRGLHRRRVDGIIVATSQLDTAYQERLAALRVPVVLVNSQVIGRDQRIYSVSVDDAAGARLAVDHLLSLGHHRIGYLGVSDRPGSNQRRLQGYRRALASAGIEPRPEWVQVAPAPVVPRTDDSAVGRKLGKALLESDVTAVFCYNDLLAAGVLSLAAEYKVPVPEGLSVVGFDNITLSSYTVPPLTTVHQPKRRMGRCAMQMVLGLLSGKEASNRIFQPTLKVRESTVPSTNISGQKRALCQQS